MTGLLALRETDTTSSRRSPARSATSQGGTSQRADIQGMRAIAVLLVVASHAGIKDLFSGGYIGVDIFFVISGFLITGVLAREVHKTGRVSFATFYARRARRILPAASLVLLVIVVASAAVYTDGHLDQVTKDVGWAAFFAANLNFALANTDYFAVNSFETPVQHFWSLAVEEQFYLVWPALVAVMLLVPWGRRTWTRRTHDTGDSGQVGARAALRRRQALRRAAVLIAILSAASLVWSVHDTAVSAHSAYYSTFTRAWELGLGALLALGAHRVGRLPAEVKAVLSWVGLTMIGYAAWTFTPSTPFPGSAALLPVVGAALVIAGGIDGPRYGAAKALGIRPLRFVGDISYSLYLWHWPLLVMPAAFVAPDPLRIRYKLALIAIAILLSWLSYRWVETPFRTAKVFRRRNVRTLVLWPVALAVVLVPTAGIYQSTVAQVPTPTRPSPKQVMKASTGGLRGDVIAAAEKAKKGAALPSALRPNLVDLADDKTEPADGCWASGRSQTSHKICPVGDKDATTTVVVFGDSHMGQWLKPLETLAKKHHVKLLPIEKAACVPADVEPIFRGSKYPECGTFHTWALKQIKRIDPDGIILSGQISIRFVDPDTGKIASDAQGTKLFEAGAKRTLEKLHKITPNVTVISDQTNLPKDAETCLGARTADMSTCAEPLNERSKKRDAAWHKVAKQTGSRFVDMLPWLCADGECPLVIDGDIVYRDKHHLSTTYAEKLTPVLGKKLRLGDL